MFYWIASHDASNGFNWANHVAELDNLGEAGFNGDHLVLGDRSALEVIADLACLSRKARAYFRSASVRFTTVGGLKRHIRPTYVSASYNAPTYHGSDLFIPLVYFSSVHSASRSILVVEHMHDYEVIVALGESEIAHRRLGSAIKLSLTPASGGGGGTHLTLKTYQQNAATSGLCVVDSDRPHQEGALGVTAVTCQKAHAASWKWSLHILEARELENVIPPDFIASTGLPAPVQGVDFYNDQLWAIFGYIDLKLADNLCRYFSIGPSNASYVATRNALTVFAALASSCHQCLLASACSHVATCSLNTAAPSLLSNVANWIRAPMNKFPRRITARVAALNGLLDETLRVGVAAGWSST